MLVYHLPELVGPLGQIRMIGIVGHREFRSEKEVPDCVLVEDAVNQDPLGMALEVDAVIAATEAVKGASIALDLAEEGPVQGIEIFRQDLEFREKVQLEILGKCAHFGGADGIEDDLKHGEESRVNQEIRKSGKNPNTGRQPNCENRPRPSFPVFLLC